jgi:hypothetical protein
MSVIFWVDIKSCGAIYNQFNISTYVDNAKQLLYKRFHYIRCLYSIEIIYFLKLVIVI